MPTLTIKPIFSVTRFKYISWVDLIFVLPIFNLIVTCEWIIKTHSTVYIITQSFISAKRTTSIFQWYIFDNTIKQMSTFTIKPILFMTTSSHTFWTNLIFTTPIFGFLVWSKRLLECELFLFFHIFVMSSLC